MAEIAAFRTLRFGPGAPRVAGGGRYDVRALTRADADGSYRTAAATYDSWRQRGLLTPDAEPAVWILEIATREGDRTAGVVAALRLDDAVLPHEEIDPALVARRRTRLAAVPADLAPVAVYPARPVPALMAAVTRHRRGTPTADLRDERGTRFRLWRVAAGPAPAGPAPVGRSPVSVLAGALRGVRLVVADGHHRVAAARRAAAVGATGTTLGFVAATAPRSRPVHRLLFADDPGAVVAQLREAFVLVPVPAEQAEDRLARADGAARFALLLRDGRCWLLAPRRPAALLAAAPADRPAAWRRLDAVLWRHGVAPRLRGVATRPADASALDGPATDDAAGLLLLRPIDTAVVTRLALAGTVMPPKVTHFHPKPRTGLLVRSAVDPP